MIPWKERPVEIANLLNPAFCSSLIRQAVIGYEKQVEKGIDFPLTFLVLPLVLHRETRESIPKTTATKLHIWIQGHQDVRIGLSQRTRNLLPYTREAIIYGMQRNILSMDNGKLTAPKLRQKTIDINGTEAAQCLDRALFLGRWLSTAGGVVPTMSMFGFRI